MPIIEMQDIVKTYFIGETTIQALKNISLKIQKGEFVAVWGPSGSGKSTLLNLMGTIDYPTSGHFFLKG